MKDDLEPRRPRFGLLLVAVSMVLVFLGIVWAYQREPRRAVELDEVPKAAAATMAGSVGTSGVGIAPAVDDRSGPPAVMPPAIIQELETITGSVDGQELIGRRVDLHVTVHSVPNEVAFWIGGKDNRLLVVLRRDPRGRTARQPGLPPRHGIAPVHAGQQATIAGSVQPLPKSEEMHSWQLTEPEFAELLDRKLYIRADTVTTEGHGAHGI